MTTDDLDESLYREPVAMLLGLAALDRNPPDTRRDTSGVTSRDTGTSTDTGQSDGTSADTDRPAAVDSAPMEVDRALEAILMVAEDAQSLISLASAIDRPVAVVRQAIERLTADYDGRAAGPRRGFELREVAGGWRIYAREQYDAVVRDFVLTQSPTKLSQAALETLAVIAYKQPITRSQVAAIRAVSVDGVVRTLATRGLITELYTDSETGAVHWGTTEMLLTQLGIGSIEDLPPLSPLLADADGITDVF